MRTLEMAVFTARREGRLTQGDHVPGTAFPSVLAEASVGSNLTHTPLAGRTSRHGDVLHWPLERHSSSDYQVNHTGLQRVNDTGRSGGAYRRIEIKGPSVYHVPNEAEGKES